MKKNVLTGVFLAFSLWGSMSYAECQYYTPALQAMPKGEDSIINVDGSNVEVAYLIAESVSLRAAGFQHVCPETIAKENILFVFQAEFSSAFHMRNVYAPLDIAFVDENGVIIDIQTMYPYSIISIEKPLYRPASAAMYALEARQGFFAEMGVEVGARLKSKSTAPQ